MFLRGAAFKLGDTSHTTDREIALERANLANFGKHWLRINCGRLIGGLIGQLISILSGESS